MRLLSPRRANPLYGNDCTANVRKEFRELIDHLREDIDKMDEPKAQALFETAAEVITGLDTAFKHFQEKSEKAWE